MNIRMIVSDIDGTLIPGGGTLSERTKRVLKACEEKGIHVVLASGRTFYGARGVSLEAGLRGPVISANGGRADASPEGGVIFEDTLDGEISLRIYYALKDAGCFMTSYVGTKIYALEETNGFGSKCAQTSEIRKGGDHIVVNDEARFLREGTVRPYKYEAYSDDTALIDRLREKFLSWGLSVSSAFSYNLEILAPGGGKGRAVEALAARFGVDRSEIMAFGDGSNDLTMLKAVGWPVAMANGVQVLKDAAWKIAPDCRDDGEARVLAEYVLGEKTE